MAWRTRAAALLLGPAALAGASIASAAAEAPAPPAGPGAGPAPPTTSAPAPTLTAEQAQGLARLRAAWRLAGAVRESLWPDLDPAAIPVLTARRGAWTLLMNHPAPPPGFSPVSPEGPDGPAVLLGPGAAAPAAAHSPVDLAGRPTAVFVLGETLAESPLGQEPSERILTRIVHEMVHVHAASKGLPVASFLDGGRPPKASPEAIALTAVENRILLDLLYGSAPGGASDLDLVRRFVAVRRARWRLMGEDARIERRFEIAEGPAIYAEVQILKMMSQRKLEPPRPQAEDPGYGAFRNVMMWRLTFLPDRLAAIPARPEHLAARIPFAGAAQVTLLDMVGADWRSRVLEPETALVDLLAGKAPMDAEGEASALKAARDAYGYERLLALASGLASGR